MPTGSWFKAHRRSLITHISVIVVFVLFTIFVAEPLFDRLERISGEAHLHRLELPAETNDIRCSIGDVSTNDRTAVEIQGWAFINGHDSENTEVYIVLKSASRTYIFDTMAEIRQDVTRHFKDLNLNLDYSGFKSLIPVREIANGEYSVGIYIRKDGIEALIYTNKAIIRSGDTVKTE